MTVQWRKGRDGCIEEYIVAWLMQQRMVQLYSVAVTLSFSDENTTECTTGSMQALSASIWKVLRDACTLDTPEGTSRIATAT